MNPGGFGNRARRRLLSVRWEERGGVVQVPIRYGVAGVLGRDRHRWTAAGWQVGRGQGIGQGTRVWCSDFRKVRPNGGYDRTDRSWI